DEQANWQAWCAGSSNLEGSGAGDAVRLRAASIGQYRIDEGGGGRFRCERERERLGGANALAVTGNGDQGDSVLAGIKNEAGVVEGPLAAFMRVGGANQAVVEIDLH